MVGETGFEPEGEHELIDSHSVICDLENALWTHIGTQSLGVDCHKLAQICDAWGSIPEHLKEAISIMCSPYIEINEPKE